MSELPKNLREKLEQAADEYSDNASDMLNGVRPRAYLAGAQALWQLLSEQAPEFDESEVHEAACMGAMGDIINRFKAGARWQHAQLSAQVAAARAEIEGLRALKAEHDQLDREVRYQVEQKAEALKERDAARAENEELMKVDYWQDRYKIACKERDDWRKGAESEAHHADCDRKEAAQRIAELERQLAEAKAENAELESPTMVNGKREIIRLNKQLDRYRAALEWIADGPCCDCMDAPGIAREALKGDE